MPEEPKISKLAAVPEGPQYLMAARKGAFQGGIIGGVIGFLLCLLCHYLMGG